MRGGLLGLKGGGLHALAAAVKLHTKLGANPTPKTFPTRAVMVAVKKVFTARGLDGVKVKMVLLTS